MRWFLLVLFLLFCVGVGVVGVKLYPFYRMYQLKDTPAMAISSDKKATVFVPTGSKLKDLTALLKKEKLIKRADDFAFYANAKNLTRRRIVPGKYVLKGDFTYNELVNHLRFGNGRLSVKVSFHYMKTLADLAKKVAAQIEPDAKALLAVFTDPKIQAKYGFDRETFHLMFLSDTYRLNWACSPKHFVKRMAKAYKKFWAGKYGKKARKLGLSPLQVATLASIVQAEQSKKPDEWPKIAGLYINRLKRGMKLESDPTVKYALKKPALRRILFKHLKVNSPYNTYMHKGLPPGPINWPEKRAMMAVLDYQRHKYIYMCANPSFSGYHNFAITQRQHLKNARLYHRWLNKQGIR